MREVNASHELARRPRAGRAGPRARCRRGTAYLAVLGLCALTAVIGVSAALAARVRLRTEAEAADAAEAAEHARSAIELGRLWMAQDPEWRTRQPHGAWATARPIGSGAFSLEVVDPADGNLADDPHQAVVMTATGTKGAARRKLQVTLSAKPVPLPALRYAAHTAGQLHVRSGDVVHSTGAPLSTNGSLRNDGTICGNVEAGSASAQGAILRGALTLGGPARALPDAGIPARYAAIGADITTGSASKFALGPGYNPWGAANAHGVYVLRTTSDVTLKDFRILGTLVVLCPGKKVSFEGSLLVEPARKDFPAIVVEGDALFRFTTAPLSEAGQAVSFNRPGVPFGGVEDNDLADAYPGEVRGLVHVTGAATFEGAGPIRGALLVGSAATSDAVDIGADVEFFYDGALWAAPPRWYTSRVDMVPLAGSWRQVVD